MNTKKTFPINLLLIFLVLILSFIPLFLVSDAEFGGADGEAEALITVINADYEPWFEPILEPASGEIESLLFALQAAVGAGVLAYAFGYLHGKSRGTRSMCASKKTTPSKDESALIYEGH